MKLLFGIVLKVPEKLYQAQCFHTKNTARLEVFISDLKMPVLIVDPVTVIFFLSMAQEPQ
jgi:hypothetical protein